ncbi:MAG TPA: hypothetical protein DCQ77_11590 [Betaproteobacteria bacterium]|nr:hypothetical protein [Betaproteobacteria bacterium]
MHVASLAFRGLWRVADGQSTIYQTIHHASRPLYELIGPHCLALVCTYSRALLSASSDVIRLI